MLDTRQHEHSGKPKCDVTTHPTWNYEHNQSYPVGREYYFWSESFDLTSGINVTIKLTIFNRRYINMLLYIFQHHIQSPGMQNISTSRKWPNRRNKSLLIIDNHIDSFHILDILHSMAYIYDRVVEWYHIETYNLQKIEHNHSLPIKHSAIFVYSMFLGCFVGKMYM